MIQTPTHNTQYIILFSEVRDWSSFLPECVSLFNAYRGRGGNSADSKPLPQSFTFMRRAMMPRRGQGLQVSDRLPRSLRTNDMNIADNDVFAMVKETMASSGLSQDPLLVMAGGQLNYSKKCLQMANSSSCPKYQASIDGERYNELRSIYLAFKRDFPHMRRAAAFYESMLRGDSTVGDVPKLTFLERAAQQNQQPLPPSVSETPRGPKPHELMVRFHRER